MPPKSFLLTPCPPQIVVERRRLAKLIYEIRRDVQAAGGVKEKDISRLIREYRKNKRTHS